MSRPEWLCEKCEHTECVKYRNEAFLQRMKDTIADMVEQHCTADGGELHSFGIRTNAEAMRLLAEFGILELDYNAGRMVRGRWVK